MQTRTLKHGVVELVVGDIVDQDTDAIVNAANTKLLGGGGVDGAIHRAAGPKLLRWCSEIPADADGRRCPTGEVRSTAAGKLASKIVIHGVGPFYNERYRDKSAKLLSQVHQLALEEAVKHHCQSIAFPAISTGAYRFPIADAATIAVGVACRFLETESSLSLCRFVFLKQSQCDVFAAALESWHPTE